MRGKRENIGEGEKKGMTEQKQKYMMAHALKEQKGPYDHQGSILALANLLNAG